MLFFILLLFIVFILVAYWKVYEKAGRPGWEAIVPFYNIYILVTQIALLPTSYFFLLFVPFVNFYILIKIFINVAHNFGKNTAFGLGLFVFSIVFFPILAFTDAEFKGNQFELEDNLIG